MAIDWFEVKRTLERQIERDQSSHGERVTRLANSVVALHEAERRLARIGGDFVKGLIRFSGMHHRNNVVCGGGAGPSGQPSYGATSGPVPADPSGSSGEQR